MTLYSLLRMTSALCLVLLCLVPFTYAAPFANETPTTASDEAVPADAVDGVRKSVVLKMMVVNPSDKFKQTYSMKSYLPEEVEPRHIIAKDDLEIGYDAQKKAYYTMKEIELEPGQSVVKSIEIEDIWLIPLTQMKDYAFEARELYTKVKETKFESRGRLLLNNIEVLLTQIYERQNDETVTPEEHISIYRENKAKIRDIELDLVALRRLVVGAAGDAGLFGKSENSSSGTFSTTWDTESTDKVMGGGTVPAWVAWRVIFGIIFFLGILTFGFYWTWQVQLRKLEKARKAKKSDEVFNMDELFGGAPKHEESIEGNIAKSPSKPNFPPSVPDVSEPPEDEEAA